MKAPADDLVFFAGLYLLEASCVVAAVAVHQSSGEPLSALVTGRSGPFFLAGLMGVVGLAVYLRRRYRAAGPAQQRQLAFTVVMNLITVLVAFGFGEAIVRLLASQTLAGPTFLDTILLPRSWNAERTRYRDLLKQLPTSYWVPDELLGWTIGPNRGRGMYCSSGEGIRSVAPDVRYADRQPQHRIATVGDSFTFADEVSFEASWPNRLEQQLGSKIQVLNFGVSAYGIDQAYLRYLRDVRPWHPNLVVLGFIWHDLYRSLVVYTFVSTPKWASPFAKPRLVADAGTVRPLNVPVPSPPEILSAHAVTDLPFLEYDLGFEPMEWTWRPYHHSYLVRFVLSRLHPSWNGSEDVSRQAIALGEEIIASFARIATDEGSTPLVVYFPGRSDFEGSARPEKISVLGFLRERRIRYEDLTSCLSKFDVSDLFIEGRTHYSHEGNARVATCLAPVLAELLGHRERPLDSISK